MILETLCVGAFQVNCYILASKSNSPAIIIDPGDEENSIRQLLNKHKLKAGLIINTHGHIDHIGSDDKFGVPIYIHKEDLALLKDPNINLSAFLARPFSIESNIKTLKDKESVVLGQIELEVIHTPGHTPGGICLLMKEPVDKILFSGDTLFYRGIGRTDFSGADESLLIKSIKDKLFKLPDDTIVYPGHGQPSTIGQEKKSNPYLLY